MFIMLGYDGEEVADLEQTVDHLKKAAPDVFLTTVAYPIKGTRLLQHRAGPRHRTEAVGPAHRPRPDRGRAALAALLQLRHALDGQRGGASIAC